MDFSVLHLLRDRRTAASARLVIAPASPTSSPSPRKTCRAEAALKVAIPGTGTPRCKSRQGPASSVGFRGRRPGARSGEEPPVRSSVKPSQTANNNLKDDLIGRTREVWQPRLGRDLSREDARQIAANVTGFFSVLAEWSRIELAPPANDTGAPDASENGGARHDC